MNALKQGCILSFTLLTACTHPLPSQTVFTEPHTTARALHPVPMNTNHITDWNASGAIAARNGQQGWNASLNWTQHGANRYQIRLYGPLGGGNVLIEQKKDTITYVDGSKRITSHHAEDLLYKQTGIRLPVQNLYYWVRGLAAPGNPAAKSFDNHHQLISLQQDGYTLNYMRYTSYGPYILPQKISLVGHGVTVKLIIKQWQIFATTPR